jgi:hypothetical protein
MSQPPLIKPNVQVDEQRQKRQEEGEDQLAMHAQKGKSSSSLNIHCEGWAQSHLPFLGICELDAIGANRGSASTAKKGSRFSQVQYFYR